MKLTFLQPQSFCMPCKYLLVEFSQSLFGFLSLSITKCWLWNVVWMWRKALMEKKKMLQYCVGSSLLQWWQRGLAQVRVFLHCIWLSRTTNTKQLYTDANRAEAKLTEDTAAIKNKSDDHSVKLNRSQFLLLLCFQVSVESTLLWHWNHRN